MIYRIAELRIEMKNRLSFTDQFCAEYLDEDQTTPADIVVSVTKEEFLAEKANSEEFSDGYVENICLYRNLCLQLPLRDRMLLHSAIVAADGIGYAFLGKSGAGKSTHIGLWKKYFPNTEIVNGDKPILRLTEDGFLAYGTPWKGKEFWGAKDVVPLKGLCFVEKSKEISMTRLTVKEAAGRIFTQVLLPNEEKAAENTLRLLDELVRRVPAWLLKCDISFEAAKTSYLALTNKKIGGLS
jgi:hypothetical protein